MGGLLHFYAYYKKSRKLNGYMPTYALLKYEFDFKRCIAGLKGDMIGRF